MTATYEQRSSPKLTAALARDILDAVDGGSELRLLEALTQAAQVDPLSGPGGTCEQEQLDLLRGIAIRLRLDLHEVLIHFCQRLEASRTYLAVLRHLAGENEIAPEGKTKFLAWPGHSFVAAGAGGKKLEEEGSGAERHTFSQEA